MYCLSKICCFCLRSNVQLKLLKNVTHFSTTRMDIIKILIGESIFFDQNHVLSICKDCTKRVKEVHSFCQTAIKNNRILTKYFRQLRPSGNDIGNIQIQIDKCSADTEILLHNNQFCTNKNKAGSNVGEGNLKIKVEDDQECAQESSGNDGDSTTYKTSVEENYQYENEINTEDEKEIKIEVHDDFEEMYDPLMCESNEIKVEPPEKPIEKNEEPMTVKDEPIAVLKTRTCEAREELEEYPEKSKPHKCESCGKSFSRKNTLTRHMLIHTGERPHKCETCSMSFAQKASLTKHMLVHTGEKPHKCDTCGKSFAYNGLLTRHMMLHTGEKPFNCDACGKSFTQKNTLSIHMLIHTGEKPHTCETCGKSFAHKNNLTGHMLIHTGEKPHRCETCGKFFAQKTNLTAHMLIHSGIKPHTCLTCGKSFVQKNNLTAHVKTHRGNAT